MKDLPVIWPSLSSGSPMSLSTWDSRMPIFTLLNLLPGFGLPPMISPSNEPSVDFTVCTLASPLDSADAAGAAVWDADPLLSPDVACLICSQPEIASTQPRTRKYLNKFLSDRLVGLCAEWRRYHLAFLRDARCSPVGPGASSDRHVL